MCSPETALRKFVYGYGTLSVYRREFIRIWPFENIAGKPHT